MYRKVVLTLTGIAVSAILVAQEPQRWSLKECIDYSLEHNIELKMEQLSLEESNINVKSAKAALFPSLSFSTSQNGRYKPYFDDSGNNAFITSDGSGGSRVSASQNHFSYSGSYGINAGVTIFNGGKNINNIKQQKLSRDIALLSVKERENALKEEIAKLFVQILYSTDAIEVSRATLAAAKENLKQGNEKYAEGKMSRSEVVQLQAQADNAEYGLVNSEAQLSKFKLQLKQLLEITDNSDFLIEAPEASDALALTPVASVTDAYNTALAGRPEIESSRLSAESSELSVKIARAGYYPTISLNAGAGTSNSDNTGNGFGHQMKHNLNCSMGVTLSVPIYDNRNTKSNIQKAKIQQSTSRLQELNAQKELYSTIETLWQDANSAQKKFISAKSNVESAQASYNYVNEQFNVGLKNATELLTERSNLLSAQQEFLQAKYTAILNVQLLKFYMGEDILF
ncbi:MAG: TolC family protein [Bacteroidaceae bacterium]|nr:TolC family protein [Bacteroidaceae bacterium]